MQEVLDQFVVSCRSLYRCGPSVTVDKQLINFYGNCCFRMFIPSKPGKYGLKLWVMADSDTYYCADAQLYASKVVSQCDVGRNADGAASGGKYQRVGQECHHRQLLSAISSPRS